MIVCAHSGVKFKPQIAFATTENNYMSVASSFSMNAEVAMSLSMQQLAARIK